MSFTGRLDDLDVCALVQLVGLGKKSGTLTLESGQHKGLVSFVRGEVVVASSSRYPQGLSTLLLASGTLDRQQLDSAVRFQQRLKTHQPLGVVLKYFHPELVTVIEQAIVTQIERIIIDFCTWKQGYFSFSTRPVDTCGSVWLNPLDLILEKGFCPLHIALTMGDAAVDGPRLEQKIYQSRRRLSLGRVDLLRGMLAELQHPDVSGGVLLLILRYASELMRRAVIFDVRGTRLVGLGQFGLAGSHADQEVRQLAIEVTNDSLLAGALRGRALVRGRLQTAAGDRRLQRVLGDEGGEAVVAPLISDDRVIALLYGDQLLSSTSALALDAFVLFLSQAGLAMETAFDTVDKPVP